MPAISGAPGDHHVGQVGGDRDVGRTEPEVGAQLAEPGAGCAAAELAALGHRAAIRHHGNRPPGAVPLAGRVVAPGVLLRLALDESPCEAIDPVVVDEVAGSDHPGECRAHGAVREVEQRRELEDAADRHLWRM